MMARIRNLLHRSAAELFYKAVGLDIFGTYRWLLQSLSWTPAQRLAWRLQRLGDILEFAWNNVPFYREYWGDHGVRFFRPKSLEEIQRYPVMTKDIFRSGASKVRPADLRGIRYREASTGGTTGQPVHYLRDLKQWTLAEAFHLWGWSQMGYEFGDHVGVIAGGSLVPEKITLEGRLRGWLHKRLFLFGVAMDRALARDYHRQLLRYKVKYLYGYPSILYLFGERLMEEGLRLPDLKGVVTTAEMLLPRYRAGIQRSLGCPVHNNLGCNDGGYEAYECAGSGELHYNDLQSILEVDAGGKPGPGRLLITNLWNKSTPFIRYENGDVIGLRGDPCSCGCAFPVISSVEGRTTDIITFPNGRSLSGPALTLIFRDMEIEGWQVVQTKPALLEVRVSSKSELEPRNAEQIMNVLRRYVPEDVQISVKRAERLATTKGGKLKPVWSEVEPPANGHKYGGDPDSQ